MKIQSRPSTEPAGSGEYLIRATYEQLQLIGALVYIVRLGQGSAYRQAAFDLMTTLENDLFDEEFTSISSDDVNLAVTIEDDIGALMTVHNSQVIIEV